MKKSKLCSILGIKEYIEPRKPETHIIISNKYRELFGYAVKSIEQNHEKYYSIIRSDLTISKFPSSEEEIKTNIRFIGCTGLESFRGITIDKLYIDNQNIFAGDLKDIKSILFPAAREIIFIDNEEKE